MMTLGIRLLLSFVLVAPALADSTSVALDVAFTPWKNAGSDSFLAAA